MRRLQPPACHVSTVQHCKEFSTCFDSLNECIEIEMDVAGLPWVLISGAGYTSKGNYFRHLVGIWYQGACMVGEALPENK